MTSDVSRSIEEQLSAFLDDELRDEELDLLVRRLERNEEYRATLARYSLIANVVRNDPVHSYPDQFRAKIRAAITAENVTAVQVDKPMRKWSGWRVPFASAATVAVLVLALSASGVRDWLFDADTLTHGAPKVAELQPPVAPLEGPATTSSPTERAISRRAKLTPERLSSYMVSHREYAQPLHGPIANSRIVVQQARFEE